MSDTTVTMQIANAVWDSGEQAVRGFLAEQGIACRIEREIEPPEQIEKRHGAAYVSLKVSVGPRDVDAVDGLLGQIEQAAGSAQLTGPATAAEYAAGPCEVFEDRHRKGAYFYADWYIPAGAVACA